MSPSYFLRDPEIIKQIVVKDFDHFVNRPGDVFQADDVFANSLIGLRGQKWRDMRSTLSPAFTGSKMRHMFDLVVECSADMATYFHKEAKSIDLQVLDIKEVFTRFTNDVIATCTFGVKVDSFGNRDNEFFTMGNDMMKFNKFQLIQFMIISFLPKVARFFDIKFINNKVSNFFRSLILETMQIRKEKNIFRPDMINILMQVRQGSLSHQSNENNLKEGFATVTESQNVSKSAIKRVWTDDELVAQGLLFFLAGFDTNSTMLAFAATELALNMDVQEKLYNEIIKVHEQLNGKPLSYEVVQSMQYMDMVTSEALRMWPPAIIINRECLSTFELKHPDTDTIIKILPKDQVIIPVYALHRDPVYFPNPAKFDPERFSEENIGNIQTGAYLPFGMGPRNCIGIL